MIAEVARLLKPEALRFDVAHWPIAKTYCVTVRDGGVLLLESQGPDLEACLEEILTQARAKSARATKKADLLG